jgi:membrane fusion protein (multidrug efflux system)
MSATNTLTTNGVERASLQPLPGVQPMHPNTTRRFEPETPVDSPTPKANRRLTRKQAVLGVLLLVTAIVTAKLSYDWWTVGRFIENTDDAYVGGDVTVIAPEVAGFISKLAVSDNQQVHAGDLLVTLDGRDYRAVLAKADAAVAIQRAALTNLDATRELQEAIVAQAQADITAADAQIVRTLDDQVRFKKLAANGTEPLQSFEHADADYKQAVASGQKARAGLVAAQQQLQVIETEKLEAQASLQQAVAEEETARLNLGYTELRAPIDGTVGNRSAQVGAYATVGAQLISLIPSHGLWVDANYKEDQLAKIHPGSPATVKVDSIPGKIFHGHVVSIAPATGAQFSVLPPENATGNFTKIVQRVTVRIQLDDEDAALGQLRPGLSVTAKVDTHGKAGL